MVFKASAQEGLIWKRGALSLTRVFFLDVIEYYIIKHLKVDATRDFLFI